MNKNRKRATIRRRTTVLLLVVLALSALQADDTINSITKSHSVHYLAGKLTQDNPVKIRLAAMNRLAKLSQNRRYTGSINWQIRKALAKEKNPQVCRAAAQLLVGMPANLGYNLLEQIATIPRTKAFTPRAQAEAIKALITARKKWAKYSVMMALRNRSPEVRLVTLQSLEPALDRVLANDLRKIFKDSSEKTENRILAARWLTELKDRQSVNTALYVYKKSSNDKLKQAAKELVKKIAPQKAAQL